MFCRCVVVVVCHWLPIVYLASFPGLHAQVLSLAVQKAGEGLEGFITLCMALLTSHTVASHNWSSSNRTRRTHWTERVNWIQGKKNEGERTNPDVSRLNMTSAVVKKNPSRHPPPRFLYCKWQKLGVEAWEWDYNNIGSLVYVMRVITAGHIPQLWLGELWFWQFLGLRDDLWIVCIAVPPSTPLPRAACPECSPGVRAECTAVYYSIPQ